MIFFLFKVKMIMSCLFVFLAVLSCGCSETYNTKYDNIDIDRILASKRLLDNYIRCILDEEQRCSAEGREFRRNIPEAIRTNCAKCSDAQKRIVRKTASFIMKTRPDDWEMIRKKFDPQGQYRVSFMKFLDEN